MAAVNNGHTIYFATAADAVTSKLSLRGILFVTAATASAIGGTALTVKNGDGGETYFTVPLAANSSYFMAFGGDGWRCDGLELDALPAGATMTAVLR